MPKDVGQVTRCCLKIAIRQSGIVVLFGLYTGLLSKDLGNALSKNSAVGLYRIERRVECII